MHRTLLGSCMLVLLGCSFLGAQDTEKFVSGPKPGTFMPGPFECLNINGPAEGRLNCLVCKFGLHPSVLVFVKEPVAGQDEVVNDLLKKLDEAVDAREFQDRSFSVGVIFLSPDARDSTNNVEEDRSEEIIKEAVKREKLVERLKARAMNLKNAIVATYLAEGPKAYKLNPKAEITILYYDRLKILENYAYPSGALQTQDVEAITKRLQEIVPVKKKQVKD